MGASFASLISAEHRPDFESFLKRIFAGSIKQSREFELRHERRPLRTVSIEAQSMLDGKECRAVVVDVSERKQAELVSSRMATSSKRRSSTQS